MTPFDQARRYLASIPPAVSGSGGHNQTFSAAAALVWGFCLGETDALMLLREWNAGCQPPWTEAELVHKVKTVESYAHNKPRGHLLNSRSRHPPARPVPAPKSPDVKSARYEIADETVLPPPLPDGTRALLNAAFQAGEGVRIVKAVLNDEGHEVPENSGPCLSREEWLRKLAAVDGNPNRIWKSADKSGIYITINPMKLGGSKDADVTAFRHALIEFDSLSPTEQWGLYQASKLPCTAIISSGGKSVHAWVRVDAKDRTEYDDRVKLLYQHFAAYNIDAKNKNPSRLSRLPNCIRFSKRQELLALNTGVESFSAWLAEQQASGIGEIIPLDTLTNFEPENDSNCLLGNRWVCRGGSILWVGQSGIGKSSLNMQLALHWALGRPAFGVTPARPLKSLIIQAENDTGDTAEMFQGVLAGMGLSALSDEFEAIKSNLVIIRDSVHTGEIFTQAIRRLIDQHKPDLVWLDPLLSFIGDDVSKQAVCGQFLRNWLNPIADATGVAWMMIHHTGKPSTDPKAHKEWKASDFSYYGIGSSELTNWARGVVVLRTVGQSQYEMTFAKRGARAGAQELDGQPATAITLEHSPRGIYWRQVDTAQQAPPEEKGEKESGGRPSKIDALLTMGLGPFIDACTADGEGKNEIARRLETFAAKGKKDVSLRCCKDAIEVLVSRGAIVKTEGGKYRKP